MILILVLFLYYILLIIYRDFVLITYSSRIDHSPYIVDFRSAERLPYDHWSVANTDTRFAPKEQGRTCVTPSVDGARAGPLANALFGAKHGGHRHR